MRSAAVYFAPTFRILKERAFNIAICKPAAGRRSESARLIRRRGTQRNADVSEPACRDHDCGGFADRFSGCRPGAAADQCRDMARRYPLQRPEETPGRHL